MEPNKKNKSIYIAFSLIIITLSAICLSFGCVNHELNNALSNRDSLINSYKKLKIEKNKIIINDTVFRTTKITSTFTIDDMQISSDDLIKYVNNLSSQNKILNDSLNYYKTFHALVNKVHADDEFKVIYDKANNSNSYSYKYTKIDTASLSNLNSKLVDALSELSIYKSVLNKYNIKIYNIKYLDNKVEYDLEARKVDSALLLLPHYRKELKFNSKKNCWEIKIKRFI